MYKRNENKAPAVWTRVDNVTVNGQRYDIDFSDGGSVRAMQSTPSGERTCFMLPAYALEHLIALAPTLPRIQEAYATVSDDINAKKALKKEQQNLDRAKQKELERAILNRVAAEEEQKRQDARILALTGKKLVG